MSKPLTLRNREDKGEIDPVDSGLRERLACELNVVFPSYFDVFCFFSRFLILPTCAALTKRRIYWKHEIAPATAIMAIV
jgi:hypothetical protein